MAPSRPRTTPFLRLVRLVGRHVGVVPDRAYSRESARMASRIDGAEHQVPGLRGAVSLAGTQKALVAVAHGLLVIIYHMLRDKRPFADLGSDHFDTLDTARLERHHVKRLNTLGFGVTLTPVPPAEPMPV